MFHRMTARSLFGDLERFERELGQLFSPTHPAVGRGGYPALNVGLTPETVEVYAFAPGLDPASIAVDLERGVLSLSGERAALNPAAEGATTEPAPAVEGAAPAPEARPLVRQSERFAGRFRRVVTLPEDIDPDQVNASYRDGVLRVSVQRRAAPQPRRIDVH